MRRHTLSRSLTSSTAAVSAFGLVNASDVVHVAHQRLLRPCPAGPSRVSALQHAVRSFHRPTLVCLKATDLGDPTSATLLNHTRGGASEQADGGSESTMMGASSAVSSSSFTAARSASAGKKPRKRQATVSAAAASPPASTSASPPKKRGRRPAAAATAATSASPNVSTAVPTPSPRSTRKTSAKVTARNSGSHHAQTLSSASPSEATATKFNAQSPSSNAAELSSPASGNSSGSAGVAVPPKTTGKTHCMTKRPRRPRATNVRETPANIMAATGASRAGTVSAQTDGAAPHEAHGASSSSSVAAKAVVFDPPAIHTVETPFLYYANSTIVETASLTDEAVIAERASITKLFMVSDSVASIFCVLPHEDVSVTNYLDDVDQATHKPNAHDATGTFSSGDAAEQVALRTIREADVKARTLVEERANHALCIHVRDMEQLVPPAHLLLETSSPSTITPPQPADVPEPALTSSADLAKAGKGRKGKSKTAAASRKKAKLGDDTANVPVMADVASPPSPTPLPLTPLERLLALRQWQRMALETAQRSQQRWVVPDEYHAITRVRFHDPHKADLTLVQGAGGSKSVEDVLDAMARQLGGGSGAAGHRVASAEAEGSDDVNAFDEEGPFDSTEPMHPVVVERDNTVLGGAVSMTTPYALKPLLTVYASSIPRREPLFGIRTDQQQFLSRLATKENQEEEVDEAGLAEMEECASGQTTATRRGAHTHDTASGVDASTQVSSFTPNPLSEEAVYAMLQAHVHVPPMPRFLTRITLLVEHSELEPVDLLSIAEVTTARKVASPSPTSSSDRVTAASSRSRRRGGRLAQEDTSGLHGGAAAPSQSIGKAGAGAQASTSETDAASSLTPFVPPTPRIYCLIIDGGEV